MIRTLSLLLFIISSQVVFSQKVKPHLKPYVYMLGHYNVEVYAPLPNGKWKQDGTGFATFTPIMDGTYIREDVSTATSTYNLTMINTMGIDSRSNKFKLFALDKEYGVMDVYEGQVSGDTIRVTNLHSDEKFIGQDGQEMSFRLTYNLVPEGAFELLVEFTTDEGRSWKPYARHRYKTL